MQWKHYVTSTIEMMPGVRKLLRRDDSHGAELELLRQHEAAAAVEQKRRRGAAYAYMIRHYQDQLMKESESAVHSPAAPNLQRHKDTWVLFEELGIARPYRKTYRFDGDYINEHHRHFATCPTGRNGISACIDIGVNGYLQRGDALKLYELAYFCAGDILEIGTFNGLSASIMAQALSDAGSAGVIVTDDISAESSELARHNLEKLGRAARVQFNVEDAPRFMNRLCAQGRKFDFVFIDHWHGYEATFDAAQLAKQLLNPGGFLLFHDYNDQSNAEPEHVYGVVQGVADAILIDKEFAFYGCFGCVALFRKQGQ